MAQVSWRTDDELVARVRVQALHHGLSVNEYLTRICRAATDPTYEQAPAEQVRERLRFAGLLVELDEPSGRAPSKTDIDAARQRSSSGTPLSDLVRQSR